MWLSLWCELGLQAFSPGVVLQHTLDVIGRVAQLQLPLVPLRLRTPVWMVSVPRGLVDTRLWLVEPTALCSESIQRVVRNSSCDDASNCTWIRTPRATEKTTPTLQCFPQPYYAPPPLSRRHWGPEAQFGIIVGNKQYESDSGPMQDPCHPIWSQERRSGYCSQEIRVTQV